MGHLAGAEAEAEAEAAGEGESCGTGHLVGATSCLTGQLADTDDGVDVVWPIAAKEIKEMMRE